MKLAIWYFITIAWNFCESQHVTPLKWGDTRTDTTPGGTGAITYIFNGTNGTIGRIQLQRLGGKSDAPLFAVFRDYATIMGAQIPVIYNDVSYNTVARSLCPFERDQQLIVEVSSSENVPFKLNASLIEWFQIKKNETRPAFVAVAQPIFFEHTFNEGVKTVNVIIQSNSTSCMTVSVQPKNCPVFDQNSNVKYAGLHETVTTSGSIPVTRDVIGGGDTFYIVFLMKDLNDSCQPEEVKLSANSGPPRKEFVISIEEAMRDDGFVIPILLSISCIAVIYILSIIYMMIEQQTDIEHGEQFRRLADDVEIRDERYSGHMEDDASIRSYDILTDVNDREVRRRKNDLRVSDLCTKTWEKRNDKYTKYYISLLTVAMFYFLPVVQLEWISVNNVHISGNFDACWYNFRCARPMFGLFAFNNILSNFGYVSLGILFLGMTWQRYSRYKYMVSQQPELQEVYGLPQHPGISYAIGIAVIMEGLLSASYHVCPTKENYQYDTSFMYVTGLLGMLKIYQLRHPDIIMNAHKTFLSIAFIILFALLGVKYNHQVLWIVYAIVFPIAMLALSVEFYFKGVWRFKLREIKNSIFYEFVSSKWCSCLLPQYKGRFFFLFIGNTINMLFVLFGVLEQPNDFASYLLFPFIMNLLLYLMYYIVMKCAHGERLSLKALIFLATSASFWAVSMWFFEHSVSDWSLGPAQSREKNKDCLIMNFFDNHDVWHFCSSIAIFISFTLLDRIDDDLRFVKRTHIPVF